MPKTWSYPVPVYSLKGEFSVSTYRPTIMLAANGYPSYVLFSIGNVKPLYQAAFPTCWNTKLAQSKLVCDKQWVYSIDYLEVLGIIVGQVLVGFVGDW